jgi:cytochrome P450
LVQAINAYPYDDNIPALNAIIRANLELSRQDGGAAEPSHAWSEALSKLATELLIYVFFGVRAGDADFPDLVAGYHQLGPNGVIWNITDRQKHAFHLIRSHLTHGSDFSSRDRDSYLHRLQALGAIDDTMLGNLIYMVELGRYDLRGLLRWISKYAAEFPDVLDRVCEDVRSGVAWRGSACEAFVLEVLRLEQSERLMRNVEEDFTFEGYFIPKGSLVRVCMWEIHKTETLFEQPFQFDPARFRLNTQTPEGFSPFGLDHHHCPLALLSIRLSMAFLNVIASSYRMTARGRNPPVRGPYHWEPAPDFSIALELRGARP